MAQYEPVPDLTPPGGTQPKTLKPDSTLTLLCPECGDLLEVVDPSSLIRSLHLQNACPSMRAVVGGEG